MSSPASFTPDTVTGDTLIFTSGSTIRTTSLDVAAGDSSRLRASPLTVASTPSAAEESDTTIMRTSTVSTSAVDGVDATLVRLPSDTTTPLVLPDPTLAVAVLATVAKLASDVDTLDPPLV